LDYIDLDDHPNIQNLLIAKSDASLYSYQCHYDKENRSLVVKTKEKNLFEIPLKNRTLREVYTDLYYMIVSADIAPKLINKIEELQKEIKNLQELNSVRNIE
jgi:signal recognition particle GTPase